VPRLSLFILPEELTSRIRFLAYISLFSRYQAETVEEDNKMIPLLRSSDNDIRQAILLIAKTNRDDTKIENFRKSVKIMDALNVIYSYPGDWKNFDILTLANRSLKYHTNEKFMRGENERELQRQKEKEIEKYERLRVQKTALPPIPLPDDDRIKFLSTYEEVVNEGKEMNHCVGTYAEKAIDGDCFLFHIEYEGQIATAEILRNGHVQQVRGRFNASNVATEWGREYFKSWSRNFPQSEQKYATYQEGVRYEPRF
jgi:hypothetical protein